jgi:DNA-binding CsgD family transcriptional regulator
VILDEDDYLAHYGVLRKSGRYPWGSGNTEYSRSVSFLDNIAQLREKGMSDVDIAKGFGMTIKELRETNTIAINAKRAEDVGMAVKLKEKGYSNVAIGERMKINESSVRSLLARHLQDKQDILTETASILRNEVDKGGYIDIGKGVATTRGISNEKLGSAVAILKDEGYSVLKVQVQQQGTASGNKTTIKVLCPPGTTYRDVKMNMENIRQIEQKTDDGGRTFFGILPPKSIDSSRVSVIYDEDGGGQADGVMYIRPGVEDLSLGSSRYAQVRIMVDGTHYLKGMAVYKDDLPPGVDVAFNTNKKKGTPMIGDKDNTVLKPLQKDADGNIDKDNPFGAQIASQIGKTDETGRVTELTSAVNILNKEGDWEGWKKSIASQVLSKQSPKLAEAQLKQAFDRKREELDEILALNNPAVKAKLLQSYSEGVDSAAVHLKAAALPRQASHAILPVKSLKDTEVYAPNYKDGERVALIRYPHGGTFEIPELTVNNKNREARAMIGPQAKDAIGINSKVAERLSGADFDGDSVLVIPNNSGALKSTPALEKLKGFDAKAEYPAYEGMPKMTPRAKQQQMGLVSNLITDMTIQKASPDELARAVRHSMVVIDAEKHNLDYRRSARENGVLALQKKYQPRDDGRAGGAATLISRATSQTHVLARKPQRMSDGGPIDKATGKKVFKETGESYVDPNTGKTVFKTQRSVKLRETDDAHTLVSKDGGTMIERVYADHSNRMKALANEARKSMVAQPSVTRSPSAAKVYDAQVKSLDAKLNNALRNSPRERQAQVFADTVVSAKRAANPNMDNAQIKRAQSQALTEARARMGAKKELVDITPDEWAAIQAGAISNHKLKQILDNTDVDKVKSLATPRARTLMSGANLARAKTMAAQGKTQAEIAAALGISVTTVKEGLSDG